MGLFMSFMGRGMSSSHMTNLAMGTLYNKFIDKVHKDINSFEDFQTAVLDIFNTFNSALPGKHYDVPPTKEIKIAFENLKASNNETERKEKFTEFIKEKVSLSKVDDWTLITGILTPPAAMAAKRAGENVPQLNIIKSIPDVFFVPLATVLALISVKVSRRVFMGNLA